MDKQQVMLEHVNPLQVVDLGSRASKERGEPAYSLRLFMKHVPKYRVLVSGGDGTVGWILMTLDHIQLG